MNTRGSEFISKLVFREENWDKSWWWLRFNDLFIDSRIWLKHLCSLSKTIPAFHTHSESHVRLTKAVTVRDGQISR